MNLISITIINNGTKINKAKSALKKQHSIANFKAIWIQLKAEQITPLVNKQYQLESKICPKNTACLFSRDLEEL